MTKQSKPLMTVEQALAAMLSDLPTPASEVLPLSRCDGRVLAQDVVSQMAVPAFDNSAMDGYAVRSIDVQPAQAQGQVISTDGPLQGGQGPVLQVRQRIAAGDSGAMALEPFTAARIFTGAPIPPGADAVVMQEDCTTVNACEGGVRIDTVPAPGQYIRRKGEDIALGQTVLARGCRLAPAHLGLAASIGVAELCVARRVRVALLCTGNELVEPGTVAPGALPAGAIFNSNRSFLLAFLARLGAEVYDMGPVPDSAEATQTALRAAAKSCDVVLSNGGVSVGEADYVKSAVATLGALQLWQISMRPGKPFAFGHVAGKPFLGLPGNPVSSLVGFVLLVRPFLLAMQGVAAANTAVPALSLPSAFALEPDARRHFVRVRIEGGRLHPYPNQSSAVLSSVVWGDGLADVPAGQAVANGDMLRFLSWNALC